MKKLIAIVLVLLMAFAGSAFAITDNAVASTSSDGWIPVALNAIPGVPTTATGAGFSWAAYVLENQAVQLNQIVYLDLIVNLGNVYNDIADNGTPTNTVSRLVVSPGFNITLESTNLNMLYTNSITAYCANVFGVTHHVFSVPINTAKITASKLESNLVDYADVVYTGFANQGGFIFTNRSVDSTVAHFVFYALVSGSNPSIKATVSVGAGSLTVGVPVTIYSGNDPKYVLVKQTATAAAAIDPVLGGSGNVYFLYDKNGAMPLVAFKLKANGTLDDGAVYVNPSAFSLATGPVVAGDPLKTYQTAAAAGATNFAKVYKNYAVGTVSGWVIEDEQLRIYDASKVNMVVENAGAPVAVSTYIQEVFTFFGFDFAKNGVVNDAAFLSFGGAFKYVATKDFSTVEDVVVDPDDDTDDADVPVTADTASTFGFVMIGVAIIAAASLAVVAKKSR